MSGRNWKKFIDNNIVLLTGIPLILGIHLSWWKIQQNPDLVDPKDRREMPLYSMYKAMYSKLFGTNLSETDISSSAEHGGQSFKE